MAQVLVPIAATAATTAVATIAPIAIEAASRYLTKKFSSGTNTKKNNSADPNYNYYPQNQMYYPSSIPNQSYPPQNYYSPNNQPPVNFYYNKSKKPKIPGAAKGGSSAANEDNGISLDVDGIIINFKSQLANADLFAFFDKAHKSLLKSDWNNGINLYHFLHYAFITFMNVRDKTHIKCQFCAAAHCNEALHDMIDRSRYFFFLHRHEMKNMFASMYQCATATVNMFFMILMPPCNPHNGVFAYDLHAVVEERVKKINQMSPHKVFYHGIIYNRSTSDELFAQYAGAVLAKSTEFDRHVFLYATHTVTKPQHWCLVFIDLKSNIYIHYNSLGAHKDFNDTLYQILKHDACYPKLELIRNVERNQGRSKLCGVFVYDMLYELSKTAPENLRSAFEEYTSERLTEQSEKYIDQVIAKRVDNYFTPGSSTSTLFTAVFNNCAATQLIDSLEV